MKSLPVPFQQRSASGYCVAVSGSVAVGTIRVANWTDRDGQELAVSPGLAAAPPVSQEIDPAKAGAIEFTEVALEGGGTPPGWSYGDAVRILSLPEASTREVEGLTVYEGLVRAVSVRGAHWTVELVDASLDRLRESTLSIDEWCQRYLEPVFGIDYETGGWTPVDDPSLPMGVAMGGTWTDRPGNVVTFHGEPYSPLTQVGTASGYGLYVAGMLVGRKYQEGGQTEPQRYAIGAGGTSPTVWAYVDRAWTAVGNADLLNPGGTDGAKNTEYDYRGLGLGNYWYGAVRIRDNPVGGTAWTEHPLAVNHAYGLDWQPAAVAHLDGLGRDAPRPGSQLEGETVSPACLLWLLLRDYLGETDTTEMDRGYADYWAFWNDSGMAYGVRQGQDVWASAAKWHHSQDWQRRFEQGGPDVPAALSAIAQAGGLIYQPGARESFRFPWHNGGVDVTIDPLDVDDTRVEYRTQRGLRNITVEFSRGSVTFGLDEDPADYLSPIPDGSLGSTAQPVLGLKAFGAAHLDPDGADLTIRAAPLLSHSAALYRAIYAAYIAGRQWTNIKLPLPRVYAHLEPGDMIDYNGQVYLVTNVALSDPDGTGVYSQVDIEARSMEAL